MSTDIDLLSGEEISHKSVYFVLLNGQVLGVHRRPYTFTRNFRKLRRAGQLPMFVSIYENEAHRTIYIASDGGRVCRPCIIVDRSSGKSRVQPHHLTELNHGIRTFDDFLKDGLIEYLDVNEENNSFIALRDHDTTRKHTHLEIDPMTILGVVAGLIPYPHHNQSPRNTYQCAMGKQAIGSIAYNQLTRIDTLLYLLCYPQKPMVKTRTIEMIGFEKLPAGQNATVAVMSFTGYDIEDASVLNKASLDRGYGRCMVMKKSTTTIKHYPNQTQDRIIGPPDHQMIPDAIPVPSLQGTPAQAEINEKRVRQKLAGLDHDGICRSGEKIEPGHILVNKQMPSNTNDPISNPNALTDDQYRPQPLSYKGPKFAYVDKVLITSNENDHFIVKVLMRSTRRPELGDKFSSYVECLSFCLFGCEEMDVMM